MENVKNLSNINSVVPDSEKWHKRALLVIAGLFLWRLIFILIVPLDLAGDEAYYWDWSRHLALGYYSKPPLIAWINFISSSLLPHSVFAVRMPAAVFSLVTMLALYGLARRLFSSRTAFWSVVAFAASPGSCVLGYVMTIDAPLVCFWMVSIYCLWRAIEDESRSSCWWLALGVASGLGMLSKQTMLAFPALMFTFFIFSKDDRKVLTTVKPYFATILSFAALLPPLWWNMQNEWITFQHTSHHFDGSSKGGLFFLHTLGDFVGGQLLLVSPLTGILMLLVAVPLVYRFRKQAPKVKFLLIFSLPFLMLFLLLSLRQRINANWPAVFYPTGTILLAAWGCGELNVVPRLDRLRKLFVPGVLFGLFLALLVYALPFYINGASLGGSKHDPLLRVKGWQPLSVQVEKLRQQQSTEDRQNTFLLAVDRDIASQLGFYLSDMPHVFKWPTRPGGVDSQYDLWEQPSSRLGENGLLVMQKGRVVPTKLAASFLSFRKVRDFDIVLGEGGKRSFTVFLGRNLQSWPR